ncbi:uncharacterized protein G2W53_033503 [Senna tora]|uniref:Uncharacterized protein n=1 Tax=Senna tora TaxID=362788 RepID=A0A834W805_9FABA|nr:uncharacterized protein G2W53_033503 [Senna tora]
MDSSCTLAVANETGFTVANEETPAEVNAHHLATANGGRRGLMTSRESIKAHYACIRAFCSLACVDTQFSHPKAEVTTYKTQVAIQEQKLWGNPDRDLPAARVVTQAHHVVGSHACELRLASTRLMALNDDLGVNFQ